MEFTLRLATAFLFVFLCGFANVAEASTCSFRMSNGQLIKCGMTEQEVLKKAGNPLSRSYVNFEENNRRGYTRRNVWAWVYQIKGDIGGEFIVTVGFDRGKVVVVKTQQLRR